MPSAAESSLLFAVSSWTVGTGVVPDPCAAYFGMQLDDQAASSFAERV